MTTEQTKIQKTMQEILTKYGNPAYIRITKEYSFDKVRGTHLWHLWYGNDETNFCIADMEGEHKKFKRGEYTEESFLSMLEALRDSLKNEFEKLKPKQKG